MYKESLDYIQESTQLFRELSPPGHFNLGNGLFALSDNLMKLEMFEQAIPVLDELESWCGLATPVSPAVENMHSFAVNNKASALAVLARGAKLKKKKKAKKKKKVVEVTAEMVAESDKHAAELLAMFGDEPAGGKGKGKKGKNADKSKKGKKKKGGKR